LLLISVLIAIMYSTDKYIDVRAPYIFPAPSLLSQFLIRQWTLLAMAAPSYGGHESIK